MLPTGAALRLAPLADFAVCNIGPRCWLAGCSPRSGARLLSRRGSAPRQRRRQHHALSEHCPSTDNATEVRQKAATGLPNGPVGAIIPPLRLGVTVSDASYRYSYRQSGTDVPSTPARWGIVQGITAAACDTQAAIIIHYWP